MPLKLRTLVGFIPFLAVEPFQKEILDALPELNERLQWFIKNRPYLPHLIATCHYRIAWCWNKLMAQPGWVSIA
ncbi:MAG: hypothetical protein ACXWPS_22540, partial [Ktedonobacteraceae bacterium]